MLTKRLFILQMFLYSISWAAWVIHLLLSWTRFTNVYATLQTRCGYIPQTPWFSSINSHVFPLSEQVESSTSQIPFLPFRGLWLTGRVNQTCRFLMQPPCSHSSSSSSLHAWVCAFITGKCYQLIQLSSFVWYELFAPPDTQHRIETSWPSWTGYFTAPPASSE